MLSDILDKKKCFKLVCGAGNEDIEEVEKLVYVYSLAGCNFFDLSANTEVVKSAKRGLERAGINQDRYLCVSVGIKGDPHISKAKIDYNRCISCKSCLNSCPQKAIIVNDNKVEINKQKCIGCAKCIETCNKNSISMYSELRDFNEILPPIIKLGIDCIEFHILGNDISEMDTKWCEINSLYNGMLSICADRAKLGNEAIILQLKKMLSIRKGYTTIIQADGAPMSGGVDDYKTTLQAVAMGEIIQNAKLPAYILLSGGTNSKTAKLAKMCGIDINGVAIGSFARKIIKPYIEKENFFEDKECIKDVVKNARQLVLSSLC